MSPKRLQRHADHQPLSVKQLALGLPASAWKEINWRQGSWQTLRSRFAAVRVRPAHRDNKRTQPHPEEWLLIEWPKKEAEPTKYWLSTLPGKASLKSLAKHRWIIERDYEELKQELGLGHYEGRGWRGFHHHGVLCIAAYGFLVSERNRFSPSSARAGHVWIISPGATAGLPPTRLAVFAPSGIIRVRSQPSEGPSPGTWSPNFLTVPAVDRDRDDPRRQYQRRPRRMPGGNGLALCARHPPVPSPY